MLERTGRTIKETKGGIVMNKLMIVLLALTAFMMVGCKEKVNYKVTDNYYIIVIDSCEYVRYDFSYGFQHKGNCRFCKERRQKELEELIIKLKVNKL